MSDNSITRAHYFEGQFLRTQDFSDEQAYHIAMRRRHNISHHVWGIVSGLQLVLEDGDLFVQPGMAVDGYGRELILAQKAGLSPSAFLAKGSNELDVWLTYGLVSSDQPAPGYAGCDNGNRNGASFYRWQETAHILLAKPDLNFTDRRLPKELALSDSDFNATRTPPDNPESLWPVFLGQIINDPSNQKQPLAVKLDNRPYVGLVGEKITAPSGRTTVQIGSESADDVVRFGISTRNETSQKMVPRLEVDVAGEVTVRGDATIEGDLVVAGGVIEFDPSTELNRPHPWTIYRASAGGTDELRIEMGASAAPGKNEVVIGAWFKGPDATGQEKEMFHPCLTIRDDCSVEVSGDLVVKRQIITNQIVLGQPTADTRNALNNALTSGVLATSARLPQIPTSTPGTAGGGLDSATSDISAQELADRLANDSSLRTALVDALRESHSSVAASLSSALKL